ncbi:MAG TPA: hypothetical protein VJJ24_00895 [Candidatus Paceibacterota bacterium]
MINHTPKHRHWRFKNTFLLIASLFLFFYLADTPFVKEVISGIGDLGYLGAFIAGIFFVSTFTVAPAGVVLFYLAKELMPLEVALFAGLGGVVGDFIIFRFLKDYVFEELRPVFMKLGGMRLSHLIATPYFAWLAPVMGAIIIASPLPDEVGIGLLGISKLKNWQFLLLSLVLNSLGILIVISLAIVL